MGGEKGATAHKNVGERATLGIRAPLIEQTLLDGNISLDSAEIENVRRWGNAMLKARDAWADSSRHGRRYSDREVGGSLIRRANTFGGRRDGY